MGFKYTTENSPIIKEYYYVVNLQDLFCPVVLPVYFLNKNIAKDAIKQTFDSKEQKFLSIMKGRKLEKYLIPFYINQGKLGKVTKYKYEDGQTRQDRKNIRTVARRRLRRMGLYTNIKTKKKFYEAPSKVKWIKNTQKVANSPRTIAQVIQLQRKPKHLYYRIIKKKVYMKSGMLFKLKVIRYNSKTGDIRKATIHIRRNDFIIPYLLTELNKIADEKGHAYPYLWIIKKHE